MSDLGEVDEERVHAVLADTVHPASSTVTVLEGKHYDESNKEKRESYLTLGSWGALLLKLCQRASCGLPMIAPTWNRGLK